MSLLIFVLASAFYIGSLYLACTISYILGYKRRMKEDLK